MYNRGFRRDDRSSFRSNANMPRGHNAPSLMSVSPWEGGVVPGSGGSSILGNPQMQGNQLTPQAQVLAQNLNILSNLGLLQPQLQSRQPQALPSLINLGPALNRSLSMGQQGSGYLNRGPINRYQDQRQRYGSRQDVRRPDSFNKNRPRTSQSQSSQQKLQSYRPLNSKLSPLSTTRKQSSQGGDSLAKARGDVRGKRTRKETSDGEDAEVDEDVKLEEGDEVVKKRDWKKEKNSEVIEIKSEDEEEKEKAATAVDEEADKDKSNGVTESKDKSVKEGEEKEAASTESKEKDGDKDPKSTETSIYNCHLCAKTLPDDAAFSTHLRTGPHKRVVNQLEDTYAMKVKRIREQMRVSEQKKEMEMNMRSRGRRTNMQRGHCKMCDLTFLGNITAHRKTQLHMKLKNFLHPNCAPCAKEFPARMEWDMHKLTVEHLRMVAGIDTRPKKLAPIVPEPNYARLVPKFPEGVDSVVANIDQEMADKVAPDAGSKDEGSSVYDPEVVTGVNMLMHGQHCGICSKFFARRPDAFEHCKTRTHYNNYLEMKAKLKVEAEEKAAKRAEEAAKRAEEAAKRVEEAKAKIAAEAEAKAEAKVAIQTEANTEAHTEAAVNDIEEVKNEKEKEKEINKVLTKTPVVCLKRAVPTNEEWNWKRARTRKNDDEDEEEEEDKSLLETAKTTRNVPPGGKGASKVADESDKYDPLQPTSPTHSNEATNPLETSAELLLQAVENDIDNMEMVSDVIAEAAKPVNKARRGRKRK